MPGSPYPGLPTSMKVISSPSSSRASRAGSFPPKISVTMRSGFFFCSRCSQRRIRLRYFLGTLVPPSRGFCTFRSDWAPQRNHFRCVTISFLFSSFFLSSARVVFISWLIHSHSFVSSSFSLNAAASLAEVRTSTFLRLYRYRPVFMRSSGDIHFSRVSLR